MELLDLKAHHAKAAESRTLIGHFRNALGYAMSGYCVYRVLASFKALLVGEDFSSDPVSRWVLGAMICLREARMREARTWEAQGRSFLLASALLLCVPF